MFPFAICDCRTLGQITLGQVGVIGQANTGANFEVAYNPTQAKLINPMSCDTRNKSLINEEHEICRPSHRKIKVRSLVTQ